MRRRFPSIAKVILGVTIAALLVGCGGGDGGESTAATLQDFSISLGGDQLKSGETTFEVENNGPSVHEFVVIEADGRDPADLPTEASGKVNEDELTVVDEIEDIAVGSTEELTVDLQPGDYIVFCNIDEHYASGMHAGFTVE